ncbi:MAG: hypothetical protein ABII82_17195 [Verrucomicrobiota bacterium]
MSPLRRRACLAGALLGLFPASGWGQDASGLVASDAVREGPAAVLFAGSPGRFEVVTVSPESGPLVVELGEAVWTHLSEVLALPPSGFVTPIMVRLVPGSRWEDDAPFRVWVEPAGLVTLQVRVGDVLDADQLVPALVRALLTKRATTHVARTDREGVPLWLELGCTRWVRTRLQPSLHDEWRQQSVGVRPPPLLALLTWSAGRPRPASVDLGAYGALQWLHGVGRDNGQWTEFLRHHLAGLPAPTCLGVFKAAGWTSLEDVELDWEVAFRELGSRNPLPLASIEESRGLLRRWSRFVLHDTAQKADVLVGIEDLWRARSVPAVHSLAADRTAEIELRLGNMHPFYRNAANSLGRFFLVLRQGKSARELNEAWSWFEADWRDAEELREESARLLDRVQAAATLR